LFELRLGWELPRPGLFFHVSVPATYGERNLKILNYVPRVVFSVGHNLSAAVEEVDGVYNVGFRA
jgi:hypothetical protein